MLRIGLAELAEMGDVCDQILGTAKHTRVVA